MSPAVGGSLDSSVAVSAAVPVSITSIGVSCTGFVCGSSVTVVVVRLSVGCRLSLWVSVVSPRLSQL